MSTPLYAPDGLFGRLVENAAADWRDYTEHAFVAGLADGTLPPAAFRRYLVQDYLFLIQFVRAHGLAVYKSDDPVAMRGFAATQDAILNREMALHVSFAAEWGLGEADLLSAREETATLAYTRFVLDRGLAGDLLDLAVALSPCTVGYAVIARRIAPIAAPDTPYRRWIAEYASEDYQQVARSSAARLDDLGQHRGGGARFDRLLAGFATATRLETAFWQMGLDAA